MDSPGFVDVGDIFPLHSDSGVLCRELAYQTVEQIAAFGTGSGVRCCAVVGGMCQHAQSMELQLRPHIVVASPGRLAEILTHASDLAAVFKHLAVLVLDEADRILEETFREPLRAILRVSPSVKMALPFLPWFPSFHCI
jgi:superfamily II DNA/RNA helicase